MTTYRFTGAEATVGRVELRHWGQRIELDEPAVQNAWSGGAALITQEEYSEIGFTAAQEKRYAMPAAHLEPDPEFAAMKQRAQQLAAAHVAAARAETQTQTGEEK
jgi:hypothetical protein